MFIALAWVVRHSILAGLETDLPPHPLLCDKWTFPMSGRDSKRARGGSGHSKHSKEMFRDRFSVRWLQGVPTRLQTLTGKTTWFKRELWQS